MTYSHTTHPGALGGRKFAHVVFCVPPSKNEDYVGEVEGALALWSGEGGFVFTSSGGVYAEDNGGAWGLFDGCCWGWRAVGSITIRYPYL